MNLAYLLYKFVTLHRILRKYFYFFYNKILFVLSGAKVGRRLMAVNQIYLDLAKKSIVNIGDFFTVYSGDALNPLSKNIRSSIYVADNAVLKIGSYSGMSSSCIWVNESVTIGNHVNIGANCVIIDTDAHCLDWRIRITESDTKCAKSSPIVISDNVLIGTGCIILKGVTIGENSVVGAGAVVAKSIPPNCIVAGNPAQIIKFFDR